MVSHEYRVKVRWSEADPAGIVFYPRFFEWFDLSTEALFESVGLPWPVIFPRYRIVGVPIVESGARFVAPVRYGDEVTIRSALTELEEKTFRVEHHIDVGPTRCATGFEVRAWVAQPDAPGGRLHAKAIPGEVAARLKGDTDQ
ncbi:MAG TPA: thioesterase family protein [Methylomirabilota bacterium]|jgi:4-hydroxybenzoyl-CoA thioesterase|nr:thioesterase family protein [Methylomirabilota bacterium]